jgi:hypothetical protein
MHNTPVLEENLYQHIGSKDFYHKFLTARIITATGWKVEVFRVYYGMLDPFLHHMTDHHEYKEVEITGDVNGRRVFSRAKLSRDYIEHYRNDALLEAVREGLRSVVNYAIYGSNENQTVEHFLFSNGQVRTESIK